jgi:hypothetical protein
VNISSAHIYNSRHQRGYRERALVFVKTRPTRVAIGGGIPEPGGRPGYLPVDTVHQGDLDGVRGVYHINLVDEDAVAGGGERWGAFPNGVNPKSETAS